MAFSSVEFGGGAKALQGLQKEAKANACSGLPTGTGRLDKDPRAAGKARVILRKLLNGNVRLIPDQGGLWAEYQLQPGALLRGVGTDGCGGLLR